MSANELTSFLVFLEDMVRAAEKATGQQIKSDQFAALQGGETGAGTTPHTPALSTPGGPLQPRQTGLYTPMLGTPDGRAQLYLTHPELVRQVEKLLDNTIKVFEDGLAALLDRLDKAELFPSPKIAEQFRKLAAEIDAETAQALAAKESLCQDILRLKETLRQL